MSESKTFISFQPDLVVDQVTEDGRPLYKLPFPESFFLDGQVTTEFWKPHTASIVGFTDEVDGPLTLRFAELSLKFSTDPEVFQQAVGKYMVTANASGRLSITVSVIRDVTVYAPPKPDMDVVVINSTPAPDPAKAA
jgi:hypothetical protein